MEQSLHKQDLIHFLRKTSFVTTQEFIEFYHQFNPDLPINTLRWRIYELKQQGII